MSDTTAALPQSSIRLCSFLPPERYNFSPILKPWSSISNPCDATDISSTFVKANLRSFLSSGLSPYSSSVSVHLTSTRQKAEFEVLIIMPFSRTVLITGGTTGLGYGAALEIARQHPNYLVVIASRSDKDSAAESINKALGQKNVLYLPLEYIALRETMPCLVSVVVFP